MKKLTLRYKNILLHRGQSASRNRKLKHYRGWGSAARQPKVPTFHVSIWDGGEPFTAQCNVQAHACPSNLCLYENAGDTLKLLHKIKSGLWRVTPQTGGWVNRKKRGLPRIKAYFDFSTIDRLSTAAALIITSDYDRAKRISGIVPPAIDLENWGDDAFKVLYEIGFFELIGHVPGSHPALRYHDIDDGRFRLMQIMSGKNSNELGNVAEGISGLIDYLGSSHAVQDLSVEINGAVGEAMINVAKHAYPGDFRASRGFRAVGRWWVTARADRDNNTLTLVIYDQGATIPGTLPHRVWYNDIILEIKRTLGKSDASSAFMDPEFIAHSMKRGKTQTLEPGRGEGLPQMQELIDFCGTGCLRILSRSGAYIYERSHQREPSVTKYKLPMPLEGTLVEWELKLPEAA
ncbi:hypothetical protein ABAC460_03720 [Asticcacaulis sp. AC460]|nr:hypothetical protein ABAC460_03720 [Asticcacaulis sp. AC460]